MRAAFFWAGSAFAAALWAGPLLADVKAGADAWSRGDYAGAVAQWQAPAAAGDPDAEFNLGQAYRLGRGVSRDLGRAEELFGKAAAQGHVPAADNYGLLLFDRGDRGRAMPYVRAAADRGDPRAQYLMGIAHFNGDLAPKDWVRAYALVTLAQSAGLPQASPAIQQMDAFIPLAQRQEAAKLAPQIAQAADTTRAAQIAASDFGGPSAAPKPAPAPRPMPAPSTPVAAPMQGGSTAAAATAGADYARPGGAVPPPLPPAAFKPAPTRPWGDIGGPPSPLPPAAFAPPPPRKQAPAPAPTPAPASSGTWRVQLGAFGLAANADALWARVSGRSELAGHRRINVPAGKVTKLQAGGFATQSAAAAACAALANAGYTCIPVQD